jgi:cAMP-binding proteins - catabolite gene activator and regulatory subunit of cAMP-dependent protein kinases
MVLLWRHTGAAHSTFASGAVVPPLPCRLLGVSHGIPAFGSAWRRGLISPPTAGTPAPFERPLPRNRLLVALGANAPEDAAWLASHLAPEELALGHVLAPAGDTFATVCFPMTAVISVIARMRDGGAAEVGTVGNEGVVGLSALLDALPAPHETVAQIPGLVMSIDAGVMRLGMQERPALRMLMHRSVHEYLTQVAQTAACNRLHDIEQRCARWLLMTHDRVGEADEFPLTQAYLAIMLGVRRAGVTVAAGALQAAGLITYHRGGIRVVDRAGLEAAACECYRLVRGQFDRTIA